MKTRKKTVGDLDSVITAGKAEIEEKPRKGRPKSKVKKIQCNFHLPEKIAEAIGENCRGNKSAFIEEVVRFYFDSNNIDYEK